MGGQALVRDGVAMTLNVKPGAESWIEVNRETRIYRVAAGARWRQVIGALDPLGLSPSVMHSTCRTACMRGAIRSRARIRAWRSS
jgi:FAD/FMN-containing dehydrogenase